MEEQAIISRKRLEDLEDCEKKYLSNTVTTIVKHDVYHGRWVSVYSDFATTYNGGESEKVLHEIIGSQRQTIETLKEVIELKNRSLFKRIFG